MNWKELLEELVAELEGLDDLVFKEEEEEEEEEADSQVDMDSDTDFDDLDSESIASRILEEHLHIENYYPDQQVKMVEALKNILEAGDLAEYYRIGVLLVYLSERRYIADELMDFLECY